MDKITIDELRYVVDNMKHKGGFTENSYVSLCMYSHLYEIKKDKASIYLEYFDKRTVIFVYNFDFDFDFIVSNIYNYVKSNLDRKVILASEDELLLDTLRSFGSINISDYRDLFEYIYNIDDLINLKGKVYNKKRGHINKLLNRYEGRIEARLLDGDALGECLELFKLWTSSKEYSSTINSEYLGMNNIFKKYGNLSEDVFIYGIYLDDKLEAFSVASIVNKRTVLIHIEKANPNIDGLYQFINREFLRNVFSEFELVNREDDMGIEGLRVAKMSYSPCEFSKKYLLTCN